MLRHIMLVIVVAGFLLAACTPPAAPVAAPAIETVDEPSPAASAATRPPEVTEEPPQASPLQLLAAPAIEDLAARLGVPAEAVQVIEAAEMDWPDTSLGCPAPDFAYAQVLTNGTQLILQVGDKTFDYRGRSPDTMFLCGPKGPVPPGETP